MPPPIVQNEFQYRAIRTRITALDGHLRAIRDLHELAVTNRAQRKIEDEDVKDLAPLADAASDITWTRERLLDAADAWENLVTYDKPQA